MSFANLLKHEVVIKRIASGSEDRYHRPIRTWEDDDAAVPAFVDDKRGQEINGPALGGQTITDVVIFLNADVAAPGEQDRIQDVTDGHGNPEYDIRFVKRAYRATSGALHHFEIFADVVGAGTPPAS